MIGPTLQACNRRSRDASVGGVFHLDVVCWAKAAGPEMSALTPLLRERRKVSLLSLHARWHKDRENASFTRSIAGWLRFFTLTQSFDRPPDRGGLGVSRPGPRAPMLHAARKRS